jgi:hypothetical protein
VNVSAESRVPRLVVAIALLAWSITGSATNYVAAYGNSRVILAAGDKSSPQKLCNIAVLGNYGFVASGVTEYRETGHIRPWTAAADAKTAYSRHPHDLGEISAQWAKLQQSHFQEWYKANPERVLKLRDTDGILVEGTFVGFDSSGEAYSFTEVVSFDGALKTITSSQHVTPLKQRAYCNDPVTREMFEDNTDRARQYDAKWQEQMRSTVRADLDWHYTKFLIDSAAEIDGAVGHEVNVLAITPSAIPVWLQGNACRPSKH